MKPAACLAGGLLAVAALGSANAQTLSAPTPAAMLQTPLTLPANPGEFALDQRTNVTERGLVRQNVTEASRRAGPRSVDTLRITVAESAITPGGFPSLMISPDQVQNRAYEMDYARAWPGAMSSTAGGYLIDVTPEARLGYGAAGGSLGGGATVRVMSPSSDAKVVERLNKMGVADGRQYGDQGRWYMFAAASGRAVGFSMAPGAENAWTTDPTALVSDAQVGVGWRKGDTQTSLGYMVRRVRLNDRNAHAFANVPGSDQVVGLSFSYKPQPR